MPAHELSHETQHALNNLKTYLAGLNEAVQFLFTFHADCVTQSPSAVIGGFQAGAVPPSGVVADNNGQSYYLDPASSGTSTGSVTLNLDSGEITANWTAGGTPLSVTGFVRWVETLDPPPSQRFLFEIPEAGAGFYTFATTNI